MSLCSVVNVRLAVKGFRPSRRHTSAIDGAGSVRVYRRNSRLRWTACLFRKGLALCLEFRAKASEIACEQFLIFVPHANSEIAQSRRGIWSEGSLDNPSHGSNSSFLPACDLETDRATQSGKGPEKRARTGVPETASSLRRGLRLLPAPALPLVLPRSPCDRRPVVAARCSRVRGETLSCSCL